MSIPIPGGVWLKRAKALMIAAATMQASAMENEILSERGSDLAETEPEAISKPEAKTDSSKVIDFVLAEVRKRLDPNPDTEIVELKIDPDYRGANETYLVNAVLDAHGRKLSVGVMVSVKQTPDGLQATMGYVD